MSDNTEKRNVEPLNFDEARAMVYAAEAMLNDMAKFKENYSLTDEGYTTIRDIQQSLQSGFNKMTQAMGEDYQPMDPYQEGDEKPLIVLPDESEGPIEFSAPESGHDKLVRIMERIKRIIFAEDVAALIVLHSPPGDSEYVLHLTPTYSCITMEQPGMARIRSKLADYGGDKKKQYDHLNATANMLLHLSRVGQDQVAMVGNLFTAFKSKIDVTEE